MKREKQVPASLINYLKKQKDRNMRAFTSRDVFCTLPVRAVRMKMLVDKKDSDELEEDFRTAIIPAVDVYTTDKAILKAGHLKRDALSFFVAGTTKAFPYGHVYDGSGNVCLGTIFVPSAVPERSATMPIETLFLHNDRNLSHGNSHLIVKAEQVRLIERIIKDNKINLSPLSTGVRASADIIKHDEIWSLSADVADQKPLPEALRIMTRIYDIIFEEYRRTKEEKGGESEENNE